jgi:acetyl esterase/lipase
MIAEQACYGVPRAQRPEVARYAATFVSEQPSHLEPFVLSVATAARERRGRVDLYLPEAARRHPAIVFVHGGPVPAEPHPTPRDWPVFVGYGNAAAARGVVGAVVDHRLHDWGDYPRATHDVADAIECVRGDPRVTPDRIAVWVFSGAGLMLADWLRTRPTWLRCVAATYPLFARFDYSNLDPRFEPTEAVAGAGRLPIVVTRVGLERPTIAEGVRRFLAAAKRANVAVEVIDVPNGQHGFDILDHVPESRAAVSQALDIVVTHLTSDRIGGAATPASSPYRARARRSPFNKSVGSPIAGTSNTG